MMVTFVSQCEKKSLAKTRHVLDAFANRIGSRTWQTVITNEGLQAIKKLLRKTASKNTAVSCHWTRSRSRSELVWIVGNRKKFNAQGIVSVNVTKKDILSSGWENDWEHLPLIQSLAALAALFHDWGKASELFQAKLDPKSKAGFKGDPLRHEWISTLFLNAYVSGQADEEWLGRLEKGEFDLEVLQKTAKQQKKNPLSGLPNAASLLAWLVVSHHRLPAPKQELYSGNSLQKFNPLFKLIIPQWGYENKFDEDEFNKNLGRCFDYPKGLPTASKSWMKETKRYSRKLKVCLPDLEKSLEDGSWRLILHHARLSMMLADHYYSSLESDSKDRLTIRELDLYANTSNEGGKRTLKQTLDEHLVGVTKQALRNVRLMPRFEGCAQELPRAFDVKILGRNSPAKFRWQDKVVTQIKSWRGEQKDKLDDKHFGFFAVNMASTGKGKTFANAKIMRTLSPEGESLRYILALGLRTLTLQTGTEYRERIGLGDDELAVLIGSKAVLDLYNQNRKEDKEGKNLETGSESEETLLDNELYYETEIEEGDLRTVLKSEKDRKFLHAPVLSCTIDHLITATETKRGGRYILPSLRLMSSDLVIDEIDDFDGQDLVAIGRLVHLAGMLGRKVMISSATIPPDLAEGYYNAYQSGWKIFATMRKKSPLIGCAWIDEFKTVVTGINSQDTQKAIASYQQSHNDFVGKRVKKLQAELPKRKATIMPCARPQEDSEETIENAFFSVIQQAVIEKHQQHCNIDENSKKSVSFGVVRVANIKPCIALTRFFLNADWPDDVEIRTMAYHSQQILIMRNEQEKHLDQVLKRDKGVQPVFDNPVIKEHLQKTKAQHVIFILVATPVEEVGRDHDFDWAVVEPSSYRSFIQLAGRVMRHREVIQDLKQSNIALLQYNLKGLLGKQPHVFLRPGYECKKHPLQSHDLKLLVDEKMLAQRLDAQPRIEKPNQLKPEDNLADIEHAAIAALLTDYTSLGPEAMQGWLQSCWWLTALPQMFVKFREGFPSVLVYRIPKDRKGEWVFVEKGGSFDDLPEIEQSYSIKITELSDGEKSCLWLHRDYPQLLRNIAKARGRSLKGASLIYGELGLITYGEDPRGMRFDYNSQLGLVAKK